MATRMTWLCWWILIDPEYVLFWEPRWSWEDEKTSSCCPAEFQFSIVRKIHISQVVVPSAYVRSSVGVYHIEGSLLTSLLAVSHKQLIPLPIQAHFPAKKKLYFSGVCCKDTTPYQRWDVEGSRIHTETAFNIKYYIILVLSIASICMYLYVSIYIYIYVNIHVGIHVDIHVICTVLTMVLQQVGQLICIYIYIRI